MIFGKWDERTFTRTSGTVTPAPSVVISPPPVSTALPVELKPGSSS
jgi:hypothetical protein